MKYKVGDIVVCVWNDKGTQEHVGEIFEITNINSGKYPFRRYDGVTFLEKELRLLKEGDIISWKECSYIDWKILNINPSLVICKRSADGRYPVGFKKEGWNLMSAKLVEANDNKITMTLKSIYKSLKRSEPEKGFHKAGIIDDNNERTSEGTELFLDYLFSKHSEEFRKEVVEDVLKKQDKDKE